MANRKMRNPMNIGIIGDQVLRSNEEALIYQKCSECGEYTLTPAPHICNRCFKKMYQKNIFCDDKLQRKE